MLDVAAPSSFVAPPALFCWLDEAPSSLRLRSPAPPSTPTASPPSNREPRLDWPSFDVDATADDVLLLRLHAQATADDRGRLLPHLVEARLLGSLELRLFALFRSSRRHLSTGVWSCGGYVHWENERDLDFVLLDAIDLALRRQLPPDGGVVTFRRPEILATASGVSFRA